MKKGKVSRKEGKRSETTRMIIEIGQHDDIINFVEKDKIWITPGQFLENIKAQSQIHKPKTPRLNPKDEIDLLNKNRPFLREN